jgi:transcriptional regulator with XRE-family HTH domain
MILLIKKYRVSRKMSVRNLAFLAHCSHSYITELENYKKKNPDLDIIDNIGHALNMCPIRLFGGCHGHLCYPRCYYYSKNFFG